MFPAKEKKINHLSSQTSGTNKNNYKMLETIFIN